MSVIQDYETMSKVIIDVNIILDRSWSMETAWPQTVSGLNEYIGSLRAQENEETEYRVSITTFCSTIDILYTRARLDSIPVFDTERIKANGNGTALYDAVGSVLEKLNVTNPCLLVIITDGEENASRIYRKKEVTDMIAAKKAKGNYTLVYLGVEQEAWGASALFASAQNSVRGTSVTRSADFSNLSRATAHYSAAMNHNTRMYSSNLTSAPAGAFSTENFYGDQNLTSTENPATPLADMTAEELVNPMHTVTEANNDGH